METREMIVYPVGHESGMQLKPGEFENVERGPLARHGTTRGNQTRTADSEHNR